MRTAGNIDILLARGRFRLLQGALDAVGDEGERRSALLDQRVSVFMGKHEYRHAKGGIISPRPLSLVEHPPAHHHSPRGSESLAKFLVVCVGLSAAEALNLAEGGQIEHPLLDKHTPIAQRVSCPSVRPRDVSVYCHRHVRGNYSHNISPLEVFHDCGPSATEVPIKPMQKIVRQHDNPATNLSVRPQTLFIEVTPRWGLPANFALTEFSEVLG